MRTPSRSILILLGSTLESLLREDGTCEDAKNDAVKSVLAYKLEQAMKDQSLSKARMVETVYEVSDIYLTFETTGTIYRLPLLNLSTANCEAYRASLPARVRRVVEPACTPYCLAKCNNLLGVGGQRCQGDVNPVDAMFACVQVCSTFQQTGAFDLIWFEYVIEDAVYRAFGSSCGVREPTRPTASGQLVKDTMRTKVLFPAPQPDLPIPRTPPAMVTATATTPSGEALTSGDRIARGTLDGACFSAGKDGCFPRR